MAAYDRITYLGSKTSGKQMAYGIPSGLASGQPGVLVLPTGAATPDEYKLFVDTGGNLRITSGTSFGDSDGTAFASGAGANTALTNLAAVAINTTLVSDQANTDDLGTDLIPWRTAYIKTSLVFDQTTRNLTITASEPGTSARTVNFGDPGADDSVAYLAASQALTTKTYNGLTIACASTNQMILTRGTSTITLTEGNTDILLAAGAQLDIAGSKTVDIDQNLTVNTTAVTLNQSLQTTDSPTFNALTVTSLTQGALTISSANISTTGTITCRGITNTTTAISSTAAISIAADTVNLNLGATAQGKIYATGANMYFQDSTCGPYTLQQIATGTTLNPSVSGDLTIYEGKFTWTDAVDEVAGLWTLAGTTNDSIQIVAAAQTTGNVLSLTANSVTTNGALLYLASSLTAGYFAEFYNGSANVFTVGRYGATVITGNAALTAALTITAGDLVVSSGFLNIDSGVANGGHNIATADTGSSAVPLLTLTNSSTAYDQPLLLLNGDATGAFDVLQITHDSTGYGLSVIGTAVTGKQALFQGPASQTTSSVLVDGETGSWIGAANVGMLHLVSDGALANAASSLLYSNYKGAVGAVQVLGTCGQFADTGTAGTNTWALGVSSTNNSGVYIATSATGMTGLKVSGPVGQTVPIVSIDGTATTGWVGAAGIGMLHLAVDGATANATASALQIVIGTGTPTNQSLGYALRIADTTAVTANPESTYAGYITAGANSGLGIVTVGTTARNLFMSGPASQTAAMVQLTGTYIGADDVGQINITNSGNLAHTDASCLRIAYSGTPQANSLGSSIRIVDTSGAAATSYAVYISAATNEALKVDDGIAVFDETVTLTGGALFGVCTTDVTALAPTDAEIDGGSLGTAASHGAGFMAVCDDANSHATMFIFLSDGTTWHWIKATKCS